MNKSIIALYFCELIRLERKECKWIKGSLRCTFGSLFICVKGDILISDPSTCQTAQLQANHGKFFLIVFFTLLGHPFKIQYSNFRNKCTLIEVLGPFMFLALNYHFLLPSIQMEISRKLCEIFNWHKWLIQIHLNGHLSQIT